MPPGVGATGVVGIAPEVTSGTYVAPTRFAMLRSESLGYAEEPTWRRPLRGTADVMGRVPGNVHTEGDVSIELTAGQLVWWLKAARVSVVKSGASPYVYTYTPTHAALATTTLSITVVRNGAVFGYTGCVISSWTITIEDGTLVLNMSIIGSDEASQTAPTPAYLTTDTVYGVGQYDIQIPTASSVFDTDTFSFQVEDNAEAQFRLKNTGRGAQFVKFGERNVQLSVERDFLTRTDYDAFKAGTAQAIKLVASQSANEKIEITIPAAVQEEHSISGLSGQADLIRSSITYRGVYDTVTSKAYTIVATSPENVT